MASPDSKIKVHQIREEISIGQTPNHAKFCVDPTRSVRDIRDQKFVLPEKVSQSSPNSLKTCYFLRSPSCQISSRSVKPAWRKALQIFYTLQYFGSPGRPPRPRVTSMGRGVHYPPSSNLENFVLFCRPFSEIPAAKVSRFCCGRDPQKKTKLEMRGKA